MPRVSELPEMQHDFADAGDRAAGRRDFAAQRVRELRARSTDRTLSSDTAVEAAIALMSARIRAEAAERSAAIAHESAAIAHERAARAHDVAARGSSGSARERHQARAEALRAHADKEREAVRHESAPSE
jgi:hypothetical protein